MRSSNVNGDGNYFACGEALHVGCVVGVFVAFAEPNVTFFGVVVALGCSDLEFALNVAVAVTGLVAVDLGTTGSFHSGAGGAWGRSFDLAVGGDGGEETTKGEENGG